jgi:hypothetical protein
MHREHPSATLARDPFGHNREGSPAVSDTFRDAEARFIELLGVHELDRNLEDHSPATTLIEAAIDEALAAVYERSSGVADSHLFLQRILYRINRLKLFWYDDLHLYENERSGYLRRLRDRIESAWQAWELEGIDIDRLRSGDIGRELLERVALDLQPIDSDDARYFADEMSEAGYRRLLAIASLDGLVEASQLSRTLGGPGNEVHAVMTRLLTEEYGFGRLQRKHSSFFEAMLADRGMSTRPEGYFDLVPWEVLATINHSFLLSERKRWFLRYVGGLLQTEVSVPSAFTPYRAAAGRLGLPEKAMGYWDLHIKVDISHGRWMLDDVAMPLVERYPDDAWEILLGYDQQRMMSARAGGAIARAAREAERGEE